MCYSIHETKYFTICHSLLQYIAKNPNKTGKIDIMDMKTGVKEFLVRGLRVIVYENPILLVELGQTNLGTTNKLWYKLCSNGFVISHLF